MSPFPPIFNQPSSAFFEEWMDWQGHLDLTITLCTPKASTPPTELSCLDVFLEYFEQKTKEDVLENLVLKNTFFARNKLKSPVHSVFKKNWDQFV